MRGLGVARCRSALSVAWRSTSLDVARRRSASFGVARRRSASAALMQRRSTRGDKRYRATSGTQATMSIVGFNAASRDFPLRHMLSYMNLL